MGAMATCRVRVDAARTQVIEFIKALLRDTLDE
jgi:hypothetical protein